jgi:hypothetical protein
MSWVLSCAKNASANSGGRNLARRAFEALFDLGGQKLALFLRRKLFERRQVARRWRREGGDGVPFVRAHG